MSNMIFAYDNRVDYSTTTITANTANADLPVSNIQHPLRTKVYRTSTAGTSEWIKLDMGAAVSIQTVILLDHTLTSGDSAIAIQANATDSWGSPSVNQSLTYNADTIYYSFASPQSYRWWRIIFTKADTTARDIGRVFLGPRYQCTKNISFDSLGIDPIDLSDTGRSIGGQTYSDIRDQYDQISCSFDYINQAQWDNMRTIISTCGTHTPLFIVIDPADPYPMLYYCKMQKAKGGKLRIYRDGSAEWSLEFQFAEEL